MINMNLRQILRGHNKHETIERYIILGIVFGVMIAGAGITSTIFETRGITTAVTLVGSFITFAFTVILVFYWLVRGDK